MWRDEEGGRRGAPPVSARPGLTGALCSDNKARVWCWVSGVGVFAQHLSHGSDLVARNARRLRHSLRSAGGARTSGGNGTGGSSPGATARSLRSTSCQTGRGSNSRCERSRGDLKLEARCRGWGESWGKSWQQWPRELEHEIMSMRTTTRRSLGRRTTWLPISLKSVWQQPLDLPCDFNPILENKELLLSVGGEEVWNAVFQSSSALPSVTCRLSRAPKIPHIGHYGNCLHQSAPRCAPMCLTLAPARAPSLSLSPPALGSSRPPSEWVCMCVHPVQSREQISGCHWKAGEMSERLSWYLKRERLDHRQLYLLDSW